MSELQENERNKIITDKPTNVDSLSRKEIIFGIVSLFSVILKNGIVTLILGLEVLYQKRNLKDIQSDVNSFGFDSERQSLAQDSVYFTFKASLIAFLLSFLIFLFMKKQYGKIKVENLSSYYYRVLFLFLIESLGSSVFNLLKIKTNVEAIDFLFAFRGQNVVSSFTDYLFLYFPSISSIKFSILFVWFRAIVEILYILIKNSWITGINKDLRLKSVPLFKTNLLSKDIEKTISKICKQVDVDSNSVLIPFSKEARNLQSLIKCERYIFIPDFITKNYKGNGLVGYFAFFVNYLNEDVPSKLFITALILNFLLFFILLKLITFSQTLKTPTLGVMYSTKIIDFIGFLSVILINYLQRFYELGIDDILKEQRHKENLLAYFIQRANIKDQIENVHFSPILSFISPFNSLISRCKNLK